MLGTNNNTKNFISPIDIRRNSTIVTSRITANAMIYACEINKNLTIYGERRFSVFLLFFHKNRKAYNVRYKVDLLFWYVVGG